MMNLLKSMRINKKIKITCGGINKGKCKKIQLD